jgi:hypothetical protein
MENEKCKFCHARFEVLDDRGMCMICKREQFDEADN